jgi:hypothetical protein
MAAQRYDDEWIVNRRLAQLRALHDQAGPEMDPEVDRAVRAQLTVVPPSPGVTPSPQPDVPGPFGRKLELVKIQHENELERELDGGSRHGFPHGIVDAEVEPDPFFPVLLFTAASAVVGFVLVFLIADTFLLPGIVPALGAGVFAVAGYWIAASQGSAHQDERKARIAGVRYED